eukprot:782860-Amphidinium_carterae.1
MDKQLGAWHDEALVPDVVMVQEHHLNAGSMHAKLNEARTRLKWRGEPAIPTERGTQGGVAIASKVHFPLGPPLTVPALPGRPISTVLWGLVLGGVMLITVYLTVGQSRAALVEELSALAHHVLEQKRPFIIGGDWNAAPEVLRELGFEAHTNSTILRPTDPTCHHSGTTSTWRDYFLVSQALVPR